ncbi:type II toxin-antitoxin system PemK/MazF family toxin [Methanoregula sp.]|uniref:type II toxin-antitoxin system PemK/MazF family toxin n=1 Tax=Methanoregula sp. TaxID=2052170 RepID=UPI00356AC153
MGQYIRGDVLLASVALDERQLAKTRPVVVVSATSAGELRVCPISSKPPTDAPSLPLTIDDFTSGGLDLFSESYVMTSRIVTLQSREVIGKKGRLMDEYILEIARQVPSPRERDSNAGQQKPARSRIR